MGEQEREEKRKQEPRKLKKYFAIPVILWLYDWFREKDKVRKIAKRIQAPFEIEMVQLRRILRLSNEELLQFHGYLCDNNKFELTVDEFGFEFAKAVAHFHQVLPQDQRVVIEKPLKEGPLGEGEFRVKPNEIFPWDIGFMYRKMQGVSCETKLPLWKLMT